MLIIGSQALAYWGYLPEGREPRDTDIICTFEDFRKTAKELEQAAGLDLCVPLSDSKWHIRTKDGWNWEFEIAWEGSTGAELLEIHGALRYATPATVLALKLSHRYKKNSPHFYKTMADIRFLRDKGVVLRDGLKNWLVRREAETYNYSHPKLDVKKEDFFKGDGINYIYDHDTIHLTQGLLQLGWTNHPAYTFYMKDGSDVMTSKEKFFGCSEEIRLFGVYEESCVLALERSQIPYGFQPDPEKSFKTSLMKVCTSITSGWFREYAWENHDKVLDLYYELGQDDYIRRFKENQHLLKPFKEVV